MLANWSIPLRGARTGPVPRCSPGAISAWPLAGVAGLVALASVLALVGLYGWWWQRLFGARNGDGVGAAGFMAETLALGARAVTAV